MFRSSSIFFLLFSVCFTLSLSAGPVIQFDTTIIDCGTVIEGKTDKLDATFVVKNTGDAELKLEKVRPGCGCTVVKYDSLIGPGKSAKIESQVRIKGYRAGALSKNITVSSNATNEPTVRLTIKATIRSLIDIGERYISLNTGDTTAKTLYVSSKKKDLKISEVSFTTNSEQNRKPAGTWQADMPLPVKFSWTPTDSTTGDGYRVYKLNLVAPAVDTSYPGRFTITTNHPDMPEVVVQGTLVK